MADIKISALATSATSIGGYIPIVIGGATKKVLVASAFDYISTDDGNGGQPPAPKSYRQANTASLAQDAYVDYAIPTNGAYLVTVQHLGTGVMCSYHVYNNGGVAYGADLNVATGYIEITCITSYVRVKQKSASDSSLSVLLTEIGW